MIICIDFDGTIVDHQYPHIGPPAPDAVKWLKRFNKCGAKLILFTMRSDDGGPGTPLSDAVDYLRSQGVTLYGINRNPRQKQWTSSPKAYADLYIDDAAFGCPLIHPKGFSRPCVDWAKVGPAVERLCRIHR